MESLPSYKQLKSSFPVSPSSLSFIEESRQTIRNILQGTDSRKLLIIGPCSIHERASALEFGEKIYSLAKEVSSHFFLIMRVYCEKPRTAQGWKGFLYDPHLDGSHVIHWGLEQTRKLLLELTEMEVPAATEFMDPLTAYYYDDLITWGSIGARTSSSQIHRNLASSLSMPIGFKNGIAGNLSAATNGVMAALHPHTYMRICDNGSPSISRSHGNSDAHIVLRGGDRGPNYDPSSVAEAVNKLKQLKLPQRLLIDCSHGNSGKQPMRQIDVCTSVIDQIIEGNNAIRGIMLESHLYEGNQPHTYPPSKLQYGVSITDPCLDWNRAASLVREQAERLKQICKEVVFC